MELSPALLYFLSVAHPSTLFGRHRFGHIRWNKAPLGLWWRVNLIEAPQHHRMAQDFNETPGCGRSTQKARRKKQQIANLEALLNIHIFYGDGSAVLAKCHGVYG